MVKKISLSLKINGKTKKLSVLPFERLLDVIRVSLGLTGTKEGCGEGECGACSIFLDGKLVNSCLIPAAQANGSRIHTIEGIARKKLNRVQEAFLECGGAQCGICTPGMVMASLNCLKERPKPNQKTIREFLAGNLCRCTGYTKIFKAVEMAGKSK